MSGRETSKSKEKNGKKAEGPDITFFHPDLFEIPKDGSVPYLKGYRCKKCGRLEFPRTNQCPTCWGEDFEIVRLSEKGKLYSYTEIFVGQPGMDVPYILAYVDLPEGIRVCAQLEGEVGSFRCDEDLILCVGTIRVNRDGLPITSYKFRKCDV